VAYNMSLKCHKYVGNMVPDSGACTVGQLGVYEGSFKSSWTGGSALLLRRGRR
jgi:glycerol kinase